MSHPRRSSPNVLLVEGKNDREFIFQLSNHAAIERGSFTIPEMPEGYGFEALIQSLEANLVASDLKRLGIVIDADTDLTARWAAIANRLRKLGYTQLPPTPAAGGLVHKEVGKPIAIGVWLMPDNTSPGMIEDLALQLVPTGDLLWRHALESVDRIPAVERRFKPSYRTKALMHTWLAWQEEPGTPLGLAVTRGYLNGSAPLADRFVVWLKQLFELI